jgi:preprotein translocase subunit SecA
MARDRIEDRYERRKMWRKLGDLARGARSKEDLDGEAELLKKTDKVEPIRADDAPKRNDPCPCGSGKKYKNCCARKG